MLPTNIQIERAREVHAATFRASDVRVGRELAGEYESSPALEEWQCPTLQTMDNAALKREVNRLRAELNGMLAQRDALVREQDVTRDRLAGEISRAGKQLDEMRTRCTAFSEAQDALRNQLEGQIEHTLEARARVGSALHPQL